MKNIGMSRAFCRAFIGLLSTAKISFFLFLKFVVGFLYRSRRSKISDFFLRCISFFRDAILSRFFLGLKFAVMSLKG